MISDGNTIRNNQSGLVSIVVTTIAILIVTLTIVSFSAISARETRQSTDDYLSTQAYYAAESGVNHAINNNLIASNDSTCDGAELTLSANAKVPCLLIKRGLSNSIYPVLTDNSTVVPIQAPSGLTVKNVTVNWNSTDTDFSNTKNNFQFLSKKDWNDGLFIGVLRADVTRVSSTGALDRGLLLRNTKTYFFVPRESGYPEPAAFDSGIVGVECSAGKCAITIDTSYSPPSTTDMVYLKLSAIYNDITVTVTARDSASTAIQSRQVEIDSTGQSQDVLRRILVRVPSSGSSISYNGPNYVVETVEDICKKYISAPNYFLNDTARCEP